MDRMQVRSVGFSIVRQPGPFELEIDWIKAYNTEKTWVCLAERDFSLALLLPDMADDRFCLKPTASATST